MPGKTITSVVLIIVNLLTAEAAEITDSLLSTRKVTIAGTGDIMLGSNYPSASLLHHTDNPLFLLGSLADSIASADVAFGNLEGSFLDSGAPAKKCRDTTLCYLFRMPERYAGALSAAGFDMLSLANNHFGDFGYASRIRTKQLLDSHGISYAGLTENPWAVFVRDSVRYGFCAFAPNAGTVNINDYSKAEAIVRMLNDSCDIVIVSFHGGAEGAEFQRVPKKHEIFHGEDRGNVHEFAHRMIDAGADVVFGHGPHITRAVEVYRNRFIAYSLGNFCTFGRFNIQGPNGIAPLMLIDTDLTGRFISGRIIPVFQTKQDGTRIDPKKRVIEKIRDLNAQDFPDSVISVSQEGLITYK